MLITKLLYWLFRTAIVTLFFLFPNAASSQVYGCKDPTAANYNASATVNDGSCIYNTTFYKPPVKVDPLASVLVETSGLQMAGGYLWSFNDGGNAAALYRIDTLTNKLLQTVNLGGASNIDWEDIAFDGTHFYIGDFGNNANGARTDLKIYKFPLSAVPNYTANPSVTIPSSSIEVINFTYGDQVPVSATGVNNTRFDCEAMLVDGGKIHLFSKNWQEPITTHYLIDGLTAGTYVATPLETLVTNYLVTGADKAPGVNMIALIGYQNSGFGDHFMHLLSDYKEGRYFNGNKRLVDLPDAAEMGQVEGIVFRNATYGYISNEKFVRTVFGFTVTVNPKLRAFNTSEFAPAYILLPLVLKKFVAKKNVNGLNQLNWSFSGPVQQLKVQSSSNQRDFTTIRTYHNTETDSFVHPTLTALNCYRLAWMAAGGAEQYSETACINQEVKSSFSNLVLRSNGELQLTKQGTESEEYAFQLISTDGKVLAQTAKKLLTPGVNKVDFLQRLAHNHIFLLQVNSKKENFSLKLKVE